MTIFETKEKSELLRLSLQKLQRKTPITSIGPGSVARSLAETVVNELGDFYTIMDYNTSMGLISSAQGRALDLMGELYSIERKQLGQSATLEQQIGSFYFYIDQSHNEDIVIPQGTTVFTDANNFIGEQYTYSTVAEVTIRSGRLRVFVGISPEFSDSVYTAGADTITQHNVVQPDGQPQLRCTNPKTIAPQIGFETDDNYRSRIIKEVRRSAGGTTEALRFSGLAIPGVREVSIRNTPYGLGSVEALVVPEERATAERVVGDSIKAMTKIRPAGVKLYVREPDYTLMDVYASIVLRNTPRDNAGVARRGEIGIIRYLNRLLPGKQFVYNQLIQAILDSSDIIRDVGIETLRVDGVEILRRNYSPEEDQQIIPGDIQVSIATSSIV